MKTPDPNAKAPRPRKLSDQDPVRPDNDHPPRAPSETATGFDRGTAAAAQEARTGTLPGSDEDILPEETGEDLDNADAQSPSSSASGSQESM